jgi:pimeloyl-ACP methyl ester carboxylesterase
MSLSLSGFHHHTPSCWFRSFPPRPLTVFSKPSADQRLSYWYRPHRSSSELPVLFLHGIGVRRVLSLFHSSNVSFQIQIGLWPYISFLKDLAARNPDVGIVVIEFLPISSRITDPPLGCQDACDAVSRILDSLRLPRFVLVGHSYGTAISSYFLRSPPLASRIAATELIDPIPFLVYIPHVAFNFIYRIPREANELQLWYFASRDPDVARALSRHFFWAEVVLWKEVLEGKKVAVSLSGEDQIVPTKHVWRYLTCQEEPGRRWSRNGLEVLYHPKLDHAMVFDARDRYEPLLDIISRFVSHV